MALVEDRLNGVSYANDPNYVPSDFALEFVNFIKLVNAPDGEENETPVLHYRILDVIAGKTPRVANLIFRGAAKTSLIEYLILYLAVYNILPGFGSIPLGLYVTDSIENGVKNMRKNLEHRWEMSEFLRQYVPKTRFTDVRWEFTNAEGRNLVMRGYGAAALGLPTKLHTDTGEVTIKDCKIGDRIFGADGKLTTIIAKSEVFHKPMYRIKLRDGRSLQVSEDHINPVMLTKRANGGWEEKNLTTLKLVEQPLVHVKKGNLKHRGTACNALVRIRNCAPLQYSTKDLPIDPYTLGLILGDGSIKKNGSGIVISGLIEDCNVYIKHIPHKLGNFYVDKRNGRVATFAVKGINQQIRDLELAVHGDNKFVPAVYKYGDIEQRLALLQGLMDTDGTIHSAGRMSFSGNSPELVDDVAAIVRSLGGKAHVKNKVGGMLRFALVEIWLDVSPFRLPRKHVRFKKDRSHWNNEVVVSIERMEDIPSQCIAVDNEEHQFIAGQYIRTHNTGVRGAKEKATRPVIAFLDDIVSDEDARSDTVIASIEATIYQAVTYALHPTRFKMIWNGTPFNTKDPLYKAIESGAWVSNVYPVCEKFPCEKEEFKGAWEDRFHYDYVKSQYTVAKKSGQISTFYQELMLRVMAEEDRLISEDDIQWYRLALVLENKNRFNFYITTDFATTAKNSGDYSVIAVWAHNYNGDWFWVDGIVKRQTMDKNIEDLFRLAQAYKVQRVGIEVSGQQGGFIPWIQEQMMVRNNYFTMASDNNSNKPGIRPTTNKMQRFNVVVPLFKNKKMFFPKEKQDTVELQEFMNEYRLASVNGFRSKQDDCIDGTSQLANLGAWKPSEEITLVKSTGVVGLTKGQQEVDLWIDPDEMAQSANTRIGSYIV